MTKSLKKLYEKLASYKDDTENSNFHEYGYEEIEHLLENFTIQDWKALNTHCKELTETEQVFLANVLTWWHIDEHIAAIQIKIAFELLFSKNNKVAKEALFIFNINQNHFNNYPRKVKIKQHNYVQNKTEVLFRTFYPKPSILRTEKASAFLKKHFTKKVFNRLRFLNDTYHYHQKKVINASLTLIASKFLKKDNFELYELIKNEYHDKEIPKHGSLPLIGNTNFIYASKGDSFQLFWNEITSIAIKIREDYSGELEHGLSFSGKYHLFVPKLAENFELLTLKLQDEFSISKNIFDFNLKAKHLTKNIIWKKQYDPNAHIIEKVSFLEQQKWKKDSKKGFYIVHNGNYLDSNNVVYEQPTKQLISWETSIQKLEKLPNTYYKPIHEDRPEYKQMYFDRAIQIGPLLVADMYYDYPNYHNQNLSKEIWFEGLNSRLFFDTNDDKAITSLKKEFVNYFGKPEKLNSFVYDSNSSYTLWNVNGILISINLNQESGIDLKIVNSHIQTELSQYKEKITLSDTFLFSEKVTFHIQNWKENKYAYEIIEPNIFKKQLLKNSNGFVWRDDVNQTIGVYDKKEIIYYTLFSIGIMVFKKEEIKHLEITPVKSWATDFCYLTLVTHENKHYKIATYNGSKSYFHNQKEKLENFFGIAIKLMDEEEDMH